MENSGDEETVGGGCIYGKLINFSPESVPEQGAFGFDKYKPNVNIKRDRKQAMQSNKSLSVCCGFCPNEFTVAYSVFHKSINHYCSTKCYHQSRIKNLEINN